MSVDDGEETMDTSRAIRRSSRRERSREGRVIVSAEFATRAVREVDLVARQCAGSERNAHMQPTIGVRSSKCRSAIRNLTEIVYLGNTS